MNRVASTPDRPDGTADGDDPSAAYRLPYSVRPERYDLRLDPDLDKASFLGDLRITAHALDQVERIELHAAELEVTTAAVRSGSGEAVDARIELDPGTERLVLHLPAPMDPGPLVVDLRFSGILNDQLHGFYRSTFTAEDGTVHTIATTQFEATDARRAFPCFDEPDRKAVFAVTLDVDDGLLAVSNAPVVSDSPLKGGRHRIRFADTIPMSTYLVAFVVGPLVATDPVDVDGVAVRVVHVPGREDLTSFALDCAAHALRFFSDWFAIDYPADKLDLVAIPDFAFGAMENLGCVTFRETALLVDPTRASRLEQQRVADVISHEIAHMWFGDLVTMKWWNGIWLNEAFATLMELLCVDHYRPQWQRWVAFGMERDAAMATDALHSTRPVEYPVGPPEEAQGMFDVLTYQKGASVLRMLERYLGGTRFRDGIRLYLQRHRYANTETSDLWDAIEEASGEPVRQVMDSWIFQGGFPLVSCAPDPTDTTRTALRHEPFTFGDAPSRSGALPASAIGERWLVPVLARDLASSAPAQRLLLGAEPGTLPIDPSTVLVNAGGAGFYRVAYTPEHLRQLATAMVELDPLERFNLLGDTWAAVLARRRDLDDMLVLAGALGEERDPDVWGQVVGALRFLDHVVPDAARPALARYCAGLVMPLVQRLGWEARPDEDERAGTLRAMALGTAGTIGEVRSVQDRCRALHDAALSGGTPLDPELAGTVVSVVAACGDRATYEVLLDRYRHPDTPQQEMRYLLALADVRDPDVAAEVFALAMGEVRSQNAPLLVQALLANRVHGPATWRRVTEHWDGLVRRTPASMMPRMLDAVKWLCREPELASDVRSFLADHPLRSGQRSVDQAIERLGINEQLVHTLAPSVSRSLDTASAALGAAGS